MPAAPDFSAATPTSEPVLGHYLLQQLPQGYCLLEVLFDAANVAVDGRVLEVNAAYIQLTGFADAVGSTLRELLPHNEAYWFTLLGEVARTGQAQHVELPAPQFGERWFDLYALPGGPATSHRVAVFFTDITARKQDERRQALLDQVSLSLVTLTDPTETMQQLGQQISAFFGVNRCMFAEHTNQLRTSVTTYGWQAPEVADLRGTYPLREYLSEEFLHALLTGEPLVVSDTQRDERVSAQHYGQLGIHAFVAVPLVRAGEWQFQLFLLDSAPRPWPAADVRLLRELGARIWARLEQARAEQLLRESQNKYRTLFNSLDEGVCLTEVIFAEGDRAANYRFVEVNEMFEQQTGIINPVGKLATDVAPNVEQAWLDTVAGIARTGTPLRLEAYFQDPNRWYNMSLHRVGGEGSRLIGSVFDDITARKRHAANLQFLSEVSDKLAQLTSVAEMMEALGGFIAAYFHLSLCLFVEVDEAEETVTINHGWQRADVPRIAGTYRIRDFVEPEFERLLRCGEAVVVRDAATDPLVRAEQFAALRVGSMVAMPLIRQAKWRFWLGLYRPEPYDWRADEVDLARELTARLWARLERLRAEEALRASEEQFRSFLTVTNDVVYKMSADWQHMLFLQGQNFLADTAAPRGTWLAAYIPPDDQATVGAAIQAAITGRRLFELEHRVFQADGSVGWTISRAVPLFDGAGELTGWLGAATDITARKRAEEAEQLRLRLLQQQAQVVAVLEGQEEERRRIAESLHNGIGQVLYATKLQLELLPSEPTGNDAKRLLDDAIRQTRAVSHELAPGILTDFGLKVALETICQQLSQPNLHWRCYVDVAEAPALPLPLQQTVYRLVQSLAHNVALHAQASEATLEVSVLPNWLVVRLDDNGSGFDPTTVQEGLGLKTLRSRVALLAGTLHLASAPGQGTCIEVRLPLTLAS